MAQRNIFFAQKGPKWAFGVGVGVKNSRGNSFHEASLSIFSQLLLSSLVRPTLSRSAQYTADLVVPDISFHAESHDFPRGCYLDKICFTT